MKFTFASPFRLIAATARMLWGKLSGRPMLASHAVVERRRDLCAVCPHSVDGQCVRCSCFIGLKTLIASEQCPDKPPRWKRVDL